MRFEHSILGDALAAKMEGKRLVSAVFLTYQFDPGFFEEEVLRVFFDLPMGHSTRLRLALLADRITKEDVEIAVYYDHGGLIAERRSAELDARRIPVRWGTGVFHPKNVLLLVEPAKPDENGVRGPQSLVLATLSANLTRSGWWENVEAGHIDEITLSEKSSIAGQVIELLSATKKAALSGSNHNALERILNYLRHVTSYSTHTFDGALRTQFYVSGRGETKKGVLDFLQRHIPAEKGLCLEVISPFFDKDADCKPVMALMEVFDPVETRVSLPIDSNGAAAVSKEFFDAVNKLQDCRWGKLVPKDFLKLGAGAKAGDRFVHAKVYRFFRTKPKFEYIFVGSVNATTAAHSGTANMETGILVQRFPAEKPDWWLEVEKSKPASFAEKNPEETTTPSASASLAVRYHWDKGLAEVFWNAKDKSPKVNVDAQGSSLFAVDALAPREWTSLSDAVSRKLEGILTSTTFLNVTAEGSEPATILVMEEGMSRKPSLVLKLTAADILKFWSLLSPEQKALWMGTLVPGDLAEEGQLGGIRTQPMNDSGGMFASFAGIFHAFGCAERSLRDAFAAGRKREADTLLFGQRYDSLPQLLETVLAEKEQDPVRCYITLLCAKQLLRQIEKEGLPEFVSERKGDFRGLQERLGVITELRGLLHVGDDTDLFLDWFETWFLTKAKPAA